MNDTFYRIAPKISYRRSPIQVDPIARINSLKMLTEKTVLIKENSFTINKGTKWFDIIPYESSSNFLISKKLKSQLENENVTGLMFFPTEIIDNPEKEYYGLIIKSEAGPILNLEKLNNYEVENIDFDITTWKGSDFFTLEKTTIFAVTEKVKLILEKGKFTNIEIEEL